MDKAEDEKSLLEACANGDILTVENLVKQGVDVNAHNSMNGWTPLHWAVHRGHEQIVSYLLNTGADKTVTNHKDQLPAVLAKHEKIAALLGESVLNGEGSNSDLPITPNYLSNPPFPHIKPGGVIKTSSGQNNPSIFMENNEQELVLKTRIFNGYEKDFIEVELKHSDLKYKSLLKLLCEELGTEEEQVIKIRKLPDTIIRKDKDVARLENFQELEVVLSNKVTTEMSSRVYDTPKPQPGNIVY